MNIIEFNPGWKTDIAFCMVDNTRKYQSNIREFMKNQADGTLANVYNKGWIVYQWIDEDALLRHAANKGHKWAVVFSTGTEFINGTAFFDALLDLIKLDFFLAGHILDRKDAYYELHHQCYVVNLEKYKQHGCPVVGQQELGTVHEQCHPIRSTQNWHDDYTPIVVAQGNSIKEYSHKCHGWNILSTALNAGEDVQVFNVNIRDNKKHFYPESPVDFYKHIGWAYHKLNYCQQTFVHTTNTETTHLPLKGYDQIVTPASGLWFCDYLNDGAHVVIYDYNQKSLDYWKENVPNIKNARYSFVLCNLLANDNLAEYIEPTENTLVHLSNIFNYEGTTFFYSLEYRNYKEKQLLTAIEQVVPNAEVYFSLEANLFDVVPTWHINS